MLYISNKNNIHFIKYAYYKKNILNIQYIFTFIQLETLF